MAANVIKRGPRLLTRNNLAFDRFKWTCPECGTLGFVNRFRFGPDGTRTDLITCHACGHFCYPGTGKRKRTRRGYTVNTGPAAVDRSGGCC